MGRKRISTLMGDWFPPESVGGLRLRSVVEALRELEKVYINLLDGFPDIDISVMGERTYPDIFIRLPKGIPNEIVDDLKKINGVKLLDAGNSIDIMFRGDDVTTTIVARTLRKLLGKEQGKQYP